IGHGKECNANSAKFRCGSTSPSPAGGGWRAQRARVGVLLSARSELAARPHPATPALRSGGRPSPWQGRAKEIANAARPGFLQKGAGRALLLIVCASPQKTSEGARDAGVAMDPRTLAPRGTKATRPRT